MLKVPVLLGFDHTRQIGMLEVDETQLPPTDEWHFALGYTVQSYEIIEGKRVVRQMNLVSISPTLDSQFTYADGRSAMPVGAPRQ